MISPEIFRNILRIFFTVRKSVQNVFAGEYRSVFKGHGLEFEEVREYVPGDDVRNIDWKVTARQGKPFIKKYVEERELTLIILLDLSSSLNFGTVKSKKEVAAEITALLAWSAIVNGDRIGMLIFSDKVEKYVQPRKSRHQILKLIREVLAFPVTGKKTDLKSALEYIYKMTKKRAIIFVISDFYGEGFQKPLKVLSKKHDVIPVVISDPWEDDMDFKGNLVTEDEETGEIVFISSSDRKRIKEELIQLNENRSNILKEAGLDYARLYTNKPYFKDLFMFFQRRFSKR